MSDSLITVPTQAIFMAVKPVDMRKSFDGLCAWVTEHLERNPLQDGLFIFRNKRGDRIKCLYWDRNGLAIWYKRLEEGRFKWPKAGDRALQLTPQELQLLLDGIDISKLKRLPSLSFSTVF